jgi:hypothetical protein
VTRRVTESASDRYIAPQPGSVTDIATTCNERIHRDKSLDSPTNLCLGQTRLRAEGPLVKEFWAVAGAGATEAGAPLSEAAEG